MGLLKDLDLPVVTREEIISDTNLVDEKIHFLANPHGQKVKIQSDQRIDLQAGQIYLGYDKQDLYPIVVWDNEITTHYCFLGVTGSGKTCVAEDFVAKIYYQKNNIFTVIVDIKGEWYEALLYRVGGKQLSHLKDRLFKLDHYEKGMIRKLACEDSIIVIDLSGSNFMMNLIKIYRQIRDLVLDIADWIANPKNKIQLNVLFEESAFWFPNAKSEFNELFNSYDSNASKQVSIAKAKLDREMAIEIMDVKHKDEKDLIAREYKLKKLDIDIDKIWDYIDEIKSVAIYSILLARSKYCAIGFLVQRASLVSTSLITQVGLKIIKRQTDKNDIDRIKPTVGGLYRFLKGMKTNEAIIVSQNYHSYCVLDDRITHHVSENPSIIHYGSSV